MRAESSELGCYVDILRKVSVPSSAPPTAAGPSRGDGQLGCEVPRIQQRPLRYRSDPGRNSLTKLLQSENKSFNKTKRRFNAN